MTVTCRPSLAKSRDNSHVWKLWVNGIRIIVQSQLRKDVLCSLDHHGINCLAATSRCKAVSLSLTFSWAHVNLVKPADIASPNSPNPPRSHPNAFVQRRLCFLSCCFGCMTLCKLTYKLVINRFVWNFYQRCVSGQVTIQSIWGMIRILIWIQYPDWLTDWLCFIVDYHDYLRISYVLNMATGQSHKVKKVSRPSDRLNPKTVDPVSMQIMSDKKQYHWPFLLQVVLYIKTSNWDSYTCSNLIF